MRNTARRARLRSTHTLQYIRICSTRLHLIQCVSVPLLWSHVLSLSSTVKETSQPGPKSSLVGKLKPHVTCISGQPAVKDRSTLISPCVTIHAPLASTSTSYPIQCSLAGETVNLVLHWLLSYIIFLFLNGLPRCRAKHHVAIPPTGLSPCRLL